MQEYIIIAGLAFADAVSGLTYVTAGSSRMVITSLGLRGVSVSWLHCSCHGNDIVVVVGDPMVVYHPHTPCIHVLLMSDIGGDNAAVSVCGQIVRCRGAVELLQGDRFPLIFPWNQFECSAPPAMRGRSSGHFMR